ncbi:TPA: hypothetical protein ACRNHZ_000788 [Pseudomonas aeruginosa]|uniref:hypothetical protein n=1 Tax=Pseudomonas aeruginosa TaxID=287 RepID=UPI0020D04FB3|nr:hypothetical protein [Pseudomonas aeruginosa]
MGIKLLMELTAEITLSESEIQELEVLIPAQAALATRAASARALASGKTVLKVEGTHILAVSANGVLYAAGEVKPRRKVTIGKPITVCRLNR